MIRLRADSIPAGYHRNPEATARSFRDGWFYPGDIAAIDEDGYVFLKGRADDAINFDGIMVYPVDIETVLAGHPSVIEVAVVGHTDGSQREIPVAFVVVDEPFDPAALQPFRAERLPRTDVPVRFFVMKALPRNAMGKVRKVRLREIAQQHFSTATVAGKPGPDADAPHQKPLM